MEKINRTEEKSERTERMKNKAFLCAFVFQTKLLLFALNFGMEIKLLRNLNTIRKKNRFFFAVVVVVINCVCYVCKSVPLLFYILG